MDCIALSPDGVVTILDHKTNRTLESEDVWRHKLQTRLYSMALRHLWPTVDAVRFIIGYVNLQEMVIWETTREDDVETQARINAIWHDLVSFSESAAFEERLNPACRWCARQDRCGTFRGTVLEFRESAETLIAQRTIYEKYVLLTTVAKIASGLADQIKEEIITEIQEDDGDLVADGFRFRLKVNRRRVASVENILRAIGQETERISPFLEDIFTVKVGGLDKLAKAHPDLKQPIQAAVEVKEGAPTLEVEKVTRAGTIAPVREKIS
jgi:hypothetical protein